MSRALSHLLRAGVLLACLVALATAPAASASPTQLTILQDDAVMLGLTPQDPDAAMAEAKALGVDVVRLFVSWARVSPERTSPTMPLGFDVSDPDSPGYDWAAYDGFVQRARRHGLRVMLTLSPPIPHWASEEPRRCPHPVGGRPEHGMSCMWKPDPERFGRFAEAVASRYGSRAPAPLGGQVALYSLWNEPNLEHYLMPQTKRTRHGVVDLAGRRYRELWQAGQRAIARHDPAHRNRVLFGEVAAISSPLDTLHAALCLDRRGRPLRGRMRVLQGCRKARKLPIGGFALHPYNRDAGGSVFQGARTRDSLPMAHLPRLHRLIERAARLRRIPHARGIYVTEFGFQSSPPKLGSGLPLLRHAAALNEAEALFYADPRVRSTAQYELFDVASAKEFNTGLRLVDGTPKPAFEAFRMPIVVSRLSRDSVEVWGAVRPAPGATTADIQIYDPARGAYTTFTRARTNAAGYFRVTVRRPGAARLTYRSTWTPPGAEPMTSRRARPGRRIAYRGG